MVCQERAVDGTEDVEEVSPAGAFQLEVLSHIQSVSAGWELGGGD